LFAASLAARAQPAKVPKIGVISGGSAGGRSREAEGGPHRLSGGACRDRGEGGDDVDPDRVGLELLSSWARGYRQPRAPGWQRDGRDDPMSSRGARMRRSTSTVFSRARSQPTCPSRNQQRSSSSSISGPRRPSGWRSLSRFCCARIR